MAYYLSPGAKLILAALSGAGCEAYVVGGAVRSMTLGLPVEDWDIAAEAPPEKILELFPAAHLTGREFGTVTVPLGSEKYEVTPCRREEGYTDGRHPEKVAFGAGLEQDLARRDFTMNAVAYNGRALVDPFGGLADIRAGVIRCVGEPAARFEEDALRILRAYRFAAVLDFALEPETERAALALAPRLGCISAPRVRAELQKALLSAHPARLEPLVRTGALAPFGIPAGTRSLAVLDRVPGGMLLRWWALFCLTGAPVEEPCAALQFSADFERDLRRLGALFCKTAPACKSELKGFLRGGVPCPYGDIARTFALLDPRFGGQEELFAQLEESGEPYALSMLAVTGGDLFAAGLRGKRIGETLELLLTAVLRAPALNRHETLLSMAREMNALEGR